jgi:hypothetical protein
MCMVVLTCKVESLALNRDNATGLATNFEAVSFASSLRRLFQTQRTTHCGVSMLLEITLLCTHNTQILKIPMAT